ncbi:hypothetical protein [Halalkalibacter krulwichiae]|uniref:TrbC/VIRB2 family protein n=1 Tax=Halalkalibacter krulwichiae TaxID=199441 RepID=A0A1X9MB80_9BACI|nr:hypothetical protein [Halalkalibacter krulwichiae]ARK28821.1 hypothetical protein BkAM31D_02555 [Halalkalibacter krulwichiae]
MRAEVITFSDFMDGSFDSVKIKPKNLQRLAITLWTTSAALMTSPAMASTKTTSLWSEFKPLFGVFQDVAMIIGAIAIFAGLITMVFKKRLGVQMIVTSSIIVGGCFLVPAAIMLVSIIGTMLNGALENVFNNFQLENSVKVSG